MFNKYKILFEVAKQVEFVEYNLPNGKISPYKINIDKIASTQRGVEFLAEQAVKFSGHNGFKPDYFVGVPPSATQIGVEATKRINWKSPSEKKIVWREKYYNDYNTQITHGDNVVVVDDIVATGNSLKKEVENLKFEGANVIGAISIVDRLEKENNFDFPYFSMMDIDGLFNILEMQNKIPEGYKEKIKRYSGLNARQVA